MIRFGFTPHAHEDMDEIMRYLQGLPVLPAQRIGGEIQSAIQTIASSPLRAPMDEKLSALAGFDVRRLVCGDYLIFYTPGGSFPLILAVLHGKRSVDTILQERVL